MSLLSRIPATDPLAALFNRYVAGLEPAAAILAPNLSLRQHQFLRNTEAYAEAAAHFYQLHLTASALGRLHAAYTAAVGILLALADAPSSDLLQPEQEALRVALATCFASRTATGDEIGSTSPEALWSGSEWLSFARQTATRLDLPPQPLVFPSAKNPRDSAHPMVVQILKEGALIAETYRGTGPRREPEMLNALIRLQQLKGVV
jgi:hypothetical protein